MEDRDCLLGDAGVTIAVDEGSKHFLDGRDEALGHII